MSGAVARTAAPPADVPRLARGVELIGVYEDSGLREPPYIVRRADGQVVQLAPALFALAEEIDGRRTVAEVAEAFGQRIARQVQPAMVEELLDRQLRRLGVVAGRDGQTAEVGKLDPLLALKLRTKVVPAHVVRRITDVFRPLFATPVVLAVVAGMLGVDVWLFGLHGISQPLRGVLYEPLLLLMLLGGMVLATAFHEVGHATAVRYGGGEPGVMGVGIYIVWPAFYTDITDSYRLPRGARLRADTGGMYFNAVFALAVTGVYLATGFEPLLLLVVLANFAIVQQSLPFLRLDGFYIVSDLTGVPDMLSRIRPVLASLLPWRRPDPRVTELRPWVRAAVTAYVAVLVPVLALLFVVMLAHAPRAFATGWDSLTLRYDRLGPALARGDIARAVLDAVQMAVLVLPAIGFAYTTARVAGRAAAGGRRWAGASPARGALVAGAGAAAVAALAWLWWPRGDYTPIRLTERGTLVGAVRSLRDLPSGRAAAAPSGPPAQVGAPAQQRRKAPARSSGSASQATVEQSPSPTTTSGTVEQAPEPQGQAAPAPPPAPAQTTTSTTTTTAPPPQTTATTTSPSP